MSRIPDLDEFLDPKGLTPQELYKLQSETWAQGAEHERERIIKLLGDAGDCKCSPEYGVDYDNYCYCDALALIKGEQK